MSRVTRFFIFNIVAMVMVMTGCGGGGGGGGASSPGPSTGGTDGTSQNSTYVVFGPNQNLVSTTIGGTLPILLTGNALIGVGTWSSTMPSTFSYRATAFPCDAAQVVNGPAIPLGEFTEAIVPEAGQGQQPVRYQVYFGGAPNTPRQLIANFGKPAGTYKIVIDWDIANQFRWDNCPRTSNLLLVVAATKYIGASLTSSLQVLHAQIPVGGPLIITGRGNIVITGGTPASSIPSKIKIRVSDRVPGTTPPSPFFEITTLNLNLTQAVNQDGTVDPNRYVFNVGTDSNPQQTLANYGSPGTFELRFEYDIDGIFSFAGDTTNQFFTVVGGNG